MGSSSNILLLIAIVSVTLSATITQPSSAQTTNITLSAVAICPNTSLSDAGTFPVIPLARVQVLCPNFFGTRAVKNATANIFGVYSFSFNPLQIGGDNPEFCHISVNPGNRCTFGGAGGTIRYPILATRNFFGQILTYFIGTPTYVAP